MMRIARMKNKIPVALSIIPLVAIAAGATIVFPLSFVARTNVLIGACLFPMAIFITGERRTNYLYLLLSLAFLVLATLFGVRMFYFFTLVFFLLFWFETVFGRLDPVILILVALMSPFFEQVSVILGFEFRLKLTEWAGVLLAHAGMPVIVEGNLIGLRGVRFSVDEACAGLGMLSISLLISFFLLTFQYHRQRLGLSAGFMVSFFAAAFVLNILANLLRIIFLVVFEVMPDDPMHEFGGLIILSVYVILPMAVLSRWLVKRFGRPLPRIPLRIGLTINTGMVALLISFSFLIAGHHIRKVRSSTETSSVAVTYKGERGSESRGIARFEEEDLLLYVKPIPQFFSAEHTPLFCWRGSGYEFHETTKVRAGANDVYIGRLTRDTDVLYTAWWYTNGKIHTLEQTDWRLRMLKGEAGFSLVNVTAADREVLLRSVDTIIRTNAIGTGEDPVSGEPFSMQKRKR